MPRFPAVDDGEHPDVLMTFLLVVHGLLALALVGVILLQKSEGGGLTGGGSAGGLVSARGAADLLSRTTAVLAVLFIVSSLGLAWLASQTNQPRAIDTTLAREAPPVGPLGAPALPGSGSPAQPGEASPPIAPVLPSPGALSRAGQAPAPADSVPVAN